MSDTVNGIDACTYCVCGTRNRDVIKTGGHFDSAGPDKKQDAMSCELDNTTNNDLCVGTRSTDTWRSAAHRFTHLRVLSRAKGTVGRNIKISNPFSVGRRYMNVHPYTEKGVSKRMEHRVEGEDTRNKGRKLIRNFRNILTEMGGDGS